MLAPARGHIGDWQGRQYHVLHTTRCGRTWPDIRRPAWQRTGHSCWPLIPIPNKLRAPDTQLTLVHTVIDKQLVPTSVGGNTFAHPSSSDRWYQRMSYVIRTCYRRAKYVSIHRYWFSLNQNWKNDVNSTNWSAITSWTMQIRMLSVIFQWKGQFEITIVII